MADFKGVKAQLEAILKDITAAENDPQPHAVGQAQAPIDNRPVISADFLEIVECQICLETAIPPIYACAKCPDAICKDCAPTLQECPTCRSKEPFVRMLQSERFLRTQWFECRFPGCPERLRCDNKLAHELKCPLRPPVIINLATADPVIVLKDNFVVRYQFTKALLHTNFDRQVRQYVSEAAYVGLRFRRKSDEDTFSFLFRLTGTPEQSAQLTLAVVNEKDERSVGDRVFNGSDKWYRENLPIDMLSGTFAFEIRAELL